ncbi:MAG TPA: hypothetical protein VMT76_11095 [Puia sp.]|nr:hypothetical protein [Puia sp.]
MKKWVLSFFLVYSHVLAAQKNQQNTVTGSWYGKADVDMSGIYNNYLTELVIKQKGDEIEGIFGYYFKDVYQSFFVHGTYNKKTREIRIENIPVIYFGTNSTINSIECNTDFIGTLFVSAVKRGINGHFYHDGKYKYMCPDLRVTYTLDENENQDSALHNSIAAKKIWKPQPDDFIITATETKKEEFVNNQGPVRKPGKEEAPVMKAVIVTPEKNADDIQKITEAYKRRKNVYEKDLYVESDSVKVTFYDNGDIDGDSISVFMNNRLVLSHQGLSAKAINLYMKLDHTTNMNEISMFAENLGSIPPNTALMIVSDGKNQYEVYMSSSLTQSSTVRLIRKK